MELLRIADTVVPLYPPVVLEVKLKLTFKGLGDIVYKMKQLIRESYSWEYTGEQRETERVEPDPLEEDEEIDL